MTAKHETYRRWRCVKHQNCDKTHDPEKEFVESFDVEPDTFAWTATGTNGTVRSSAWSGFLSKGLDQAVAFELKASKSGCGDPGCRCEASEKAYVDVYELSIDLPDEYLGLDMTDAMKEKYVTREATATIDPAPASATYSWTGCGRCVFMGDTDKSKVTYGGCDKTGGSDSYLAEKLTVAATAKNATGQEASATCTTNFTVVKVDVKIGEVDEDKEESEGAFIPYVADTNGVISVEGTNKLVAVSFTCEPGLPGDEMVTVSHSGSGELYERMANGELVKVTSASYSVRELAKRAFVLHGHAASGSCRNGEIWIEHPNSEAKDVAKYTCVSLDWIKASCDKMPAKGSFGLNPEKFDGPCVDFGKPDALPPYWWLPGTVKDPKSKALKVFFKFIKNESDEPGDFKVALDAHITPEDLVRECQLEWSETDGPAEIALSGVRGVHAEIENPKATGLYKYRLTVKRGDLKLESEAWFMLPRAGGEISEWLMKEVPVAIESAKEWFGEAKKSFEAKGLGEKDVKDSGWKQVASMWFDYQGVVGDPTPRYSFTDEDRKGLKSPDVSGEYGNGDFDEPSYATLKGIVVHRCKVNNLLYCVWGRVLEYSTRELQFGAHFNALMRCQFGDNSSSQSSIGLGGALYDCCQPNTTTKMEDILTKEMTKKMQTPDELNDCNLWPDNRKVSTGFRVGKMPTDYETLILGDESSSDSTRR